MLVALLICSRGELAAQEGKADEAAAAERANAAAAETAETAEGSAEAAAAARPEANPSDVESLDAIVAAVYDVISGEAGAERNWDRMRSLFILEGRLIPSGTGPDGRVGHRVWSVDDYIERAGGFFATNGFFEREVSRKVERFGPMAHVFSTYASRHAADDAEPFQRGINSFQLLNDGSRWWIIDIFWHAERPDLPIPAEYLPEE